ncbi:pentatricopeptide repeat-containing protein [Senna tora]|uniref:Pentatricopeptide repeat-containing protein n=1 Tax=Senna tora TaxID=362788 RepID=A0A834XEP3_9FABA|nr:pentatricopeptide repeat-containing protein [Senna tora]
MAGKPLLAKGLRRSIGDGRTTRVWEDPWVPSDMPMVLAQPSSTMVVVDKVSDLLTTDGGEWDVEKIRGLFNEEVCNQIISIPPDREQGGDRWVWEHDNKGVYSVKTGYRAAMSEEWNSFEGILPTIEALEQRGMRIDENCAMCNNVPEDVFHAVIDCPDLQYMWVEATYDYSSRVYHANALEWLVVEAGDWKDEQLSALAIATYYAWERRNKKKFCNEVIRVEEMEKPIHTFVKVNVDAAPKKEGGGVLGGLIRDADGVCLGAYMNSISFPNDPVKLEAMAVKKGLELALKVGCKKVIVEGDALLVMELLKTPCDQMSSLNALCSGSTIIKYGWQTNNDMLGFNDNITRWRRRSIVDSNICKRCGGEVEDSLHTIRDCKHVAPLWESMVSPKLKNVFFSSNLHDWILLNLSKEVGGDDASNWSSKFGVASWLIWKKRNAWIFNGKEDEAISLVPLIDIQVKELQLPCNLSGSNSNMRSSTTDSLHYWMAPEDGWVKINIHGSFCADTHKMGCGGVTRDSQGCAAFVEIWGMYFGLVTAWEKGYKKIIVESDNCFMLRLFQTEEEVWHPLRRLILRIRELTKLDWQIKMVHIFRDGNRLADRLANYAFELPLGLNLFNSPPPPQCRDLCKEELNRLHLMFVPGTGGSNLEVQSNPGASHWEVLNGREMKHSGFLSLYLARVSFYPSKVRPFECLTGSIYSGGLRKWENMEPHEISSGMKLKEWDVVTYCHLEGVNTLKSRLDHLVDFEMYGEEEEEEEDGEDAPLHLLCTVSLSHNCLTPSFPWLHLLFICNAMRHGRPTTSISKQLGDLLFVASITNTLSQSGIRNLAFDPAYSSQLTHPIVLKILSNPSLHPSKKIDFFNWCRSLRPNYKHSAAEYSHIFRTVCRAGYLNEVPALLSSMKEDDVVADSQAFKVLLDSFILSGEFDSALEILDCMEEVGASLNHQMYNSVLIALVRKNQLTLALFIFHKLLDDEVNNFGDVGSAPNSFVCNELLAALRRADMKVEFTRVFERLRNKKGFVFDNCGYNICIYAFGCWGDLSTPLSLFREMKEKESDGSGSSVGPDLCTYNSLISVLCKVGKVNDALIVWEELKGSGHEPDEFTYRILIQGCSMTYRIDDATRIFNEMQNNGFQMDTVVYNSLLNGLLKARKLTEACQLFEKMVEDGVRASCWTYNILIDGLLKNGRPEAAYTLFRDLKKKGQFVDGITYSIIVLQLCKEGQLEEALELVEEMEGRGFVVDLVTITSLLIGIHKHGRWDWTDRLMKHIKEGDMVFNVLKWKAGMEASMKNHKSKKKDYSPLFPSKGDFSEIMNFITSAEDTNLDSDDAKNKDQANASYETDEWSSSPHMDQLANQAKSNGDSPQLFSPTQAQRVQDKGSDSFDIDMVNTFLSIFLAKGKLNLACRLFEIFTDMGVDPVSYTYNSIMSSFVKKGYFTEAWAILNEMGEKVCPADIATYNVIIQGLGKMGRADLASSVLDRLLKQGGYLDIVMYNTLINALGKAGRIDEVNKLFEQMKDSGINPDVVTYNTLIEVHSKAGRLKDAYKFLKMMLDAGCMPNHVTDTTLDFLGREIDKLRYQRASILSEKDGSS